ncbi:MAG: TIR domain-containing protein [Chloroflexota bacterium]|nr:TIR domain-containing protein [Chloroflexota bacterium]
MQNGGSFYDIFFIYHPEDIEFTRQLAERLAAGNIIPRLDEEIGKSEASRQALRDAILRSHTIAIVLSPDSAESQLCNELIEYAVANGKRFISLIINEAIAVAVHPAIAENAYVFFREEDELNASANDLLPLLQVDAHLRLHTELLVSASAWNLEGRRSDLLLAPERAEEARQWLAEGANRSPKPSQLLVEFIHASRRQKPTPARGFPSHVALGLFAVLILVAVVAIVQSVMTSQSAATATAAFLATSEQGTSIALAAAASATAEGNSALRVISMLAATSLRIREEVLATVAVQAQYATRQAAMAATSQEATAIQAAKARATERAQLQGEIAAQAVIDGAGRALADGELDLALALAWEAAGSLENPWPALQILRQALESRPVATIDNVSLSRVHPSGEQIALVPRSRKRVQVYNSETGRLDYAIGDHAGDISAIAYAGDGQLLITAAADGEVVIRSSKDGIPIHRLPAHGSPVRAMAPYRTDSKLVTAGDDALILWDINTGRRLASYAPESEDGLVIRELLATADDARLIVWSEAGGAVTMAQHSAETLALLSPDSGGRVYLGYDRRGGVAYSGGRSLPAYAGDPNIGDLALWNPSTGQQLTRVAEGFNWSLISGGSIASATDNLQFIAFDNDAALLGVQNSIGEKRLALISLADGSVLRTYDDAFAAGLVSAHFLDSDLALSLTSDNRLVTWSTADGSLIRQLGYSPQPLARIEVDARGKVALGQAIDGSVHFWHIAPALSDGLRILDESADDVWINQTGEALLVSDGGATRLVSIADEEILFQSDSGGLTRINESGSHFAVSVDGEIQLVEAESGQIAASWSLEAEQAREMYLAPQGDALLVETEAGELLLLRRDQAAPQRLNKGDFGESRLVRFAVDSSAVLSLHPAGALLWGGDSAEPTAAYALGLAPEYATSDRFKVAFGDGGDGLYFFVRLEGGLASLTRVDLEEDSIQRQTFVDVAQGELAANGEVLLLSRVDGSLQALDTSSRAILNEYADVGVFVRQLELLEERNWLYAAADNNLLIWDLASNILVERIQHPDDVLGFSLSQNGQHVVTEDASGARRLIQVDSAQELLDRVRERIAPRALTCAEREQYLAIPFCE